MPRSWLSVYVPVLLLIGLGTTSMAQDVESRLAPMPRPWEGEKVHRLTLE